jgi:hypothetical protein
MLMLMMMMMMIDALRFYPFPSITPTRTTHHAPTTIAVNKKTKKQKNQQQQAKIKQKNSPPPSNSVSQSIRQNTTNGWAEKTDLTPSKIYNGAGRWVFCIGLVVGREQRGDGVEAGCFFFGWMKSFGKEGIGSDRSRGRKRSSVSSVVIYSFNSRERQKEGGSGSRRRAG